MRVYRSLCLALPVVLLGLLAGCDYFAGGHSHAAKPAAKAATHTVAASVDPADADLVTAVRADKGSASIELKFALRQHPQVGQPAQIDVTLIPAPGIERLSVSFRAEDGLELRESERLPLIERPEARVPIRHALTVVPARDGLYAIVVTVLTDTATDSVARSFTIPVIAGTGLGSNEDAPASAGAVAAVPAPAAAQAR
jgi:hypothetical protein